MIESIVFYNDTASKKSNNRGNGYDVPSHVMNSSPQAATMASAAAVVAIVLTTLAVTTRALTAIQAEKERNIKLGLESFS